MPIKDNYPFMSSSEAVFKMLALLSQEAGAETEDSSFASMMEKLTYKKNN